MGMNIKVPGQQFGGNFGDLLFSRRQGETKTASNAWSRTENDVTVKKEENKNPIIKPN